MGEPTEESLSRTAELFHSAGLGQVSWDMPLQALAESTGSTGAQLISLGTGASVPFNVMTGVPLEASADFVAVGGGDPAINSRVRIGMRAAELQVLDETQFDSASDMRRTPEYGAWARRYDMYNACLTNLVKEPDWHAGLALVRSERQGNVSGVQKHVFALMAPHARAAVKIQLALESEGARMLAGAMEAVRATAYFCDGNGRVRSMTKSAEALLAAGDTLKLRQGILTTAYEQDQAGLEAALAAAFAGQAPTFSVSARRLNTDDRVVIETSPLPGSASLGQGARALVIVHNAGSDELRMAAAARSLYGLSASEGAIAAEMASGRSPAAIAHRRGVSVGTVRSQVRRIFSKVGVSSQLELVARLPRL